MNGIEYQLGKIEAELKGINRRLDQGSGRHDEFDRRLDQLEKVEAKRAGALGVVAGVGSAFGALCAVAIQYFLKKF